MSDIPYMPFWITDFLGKTMDLDAEEIGAYVLLLMAQWNAGGKSLPNNQEKLRRICRAGRQWPRIWAEISRFYTEDEDGIFQKRLRDEYANVAAKREVSRRNGALGGNAKALKRKKPHVANANDLLQQNASISEPEPYKKEVTNVTLVTLQPDFIDECLAYFNATADRAGWPHVQKVTRQRKAALSQRINDVGGATAWKAAIDRAAASPLLTGQNQRGWAADFDWLCKPANFTKLMEGNYDPRINRNASQGRGNRPDPALENILRIAGIGTAPGDGFH